jgi:hypothetical protein
VADEVRTPGRRRVRDPAMTQRSGATGSSARGISQIRTVASVEDQVAGPRCGRPRRQGGWAAPRVRSANLSSGAGTASRPAAFRYGAGVHADSDDFGRASGYSVEEDEEGRFRWTAFGPAGTRQGSAQSRAEAEAAAEVAELELNDPSQAPPRG